MLFLRLKWWSKRVRRGVFIPLVGGGLCVPSLRIELPSGDRQFLNNPAEELRRRAANCRPRSAPSHEQRFDQSWVAPPGHEEDPAPSLETFNTWRRAIRPGFSINYDVTYNTIKLDISVLQNHLHMIIVLRLQVHRDVHFAKNVTQSRRVTDSCSNTDCNQGFLMFMWLNMIPENSGSNSCWQRSR